ncbi:MAG: cell wall hydrolase [Oscillibacter sp.]|jgi:N-acetylmuramoyl-L-alanine amidase|nr:cell wall hydrolase [Oscillibacter sp.]
MKRNLFAGLTAMVLLSAAVLPAQAARSVPVTVDGVLLSTSASLESGVTMVPLRTLCDALGGWQVNWDSGAQCAQAVSGSDTITAVPGQTAVTVGGCALDTAQSVYIAGGRTYVPLRAVCEALGYSVSWDSALGGAAVKTGAGTENYTEEDLYWLSRIISAESRGESLTGQIAVGNVVLNRVKSGEFPNTIKAVVFDRKDGVQFEPVSNGTVYDPPTVLSVTAAKAALAGTNIVGSCLYFYAPALSQGIWINANRAYFTTIGCHRFYR